jgi:hypothetical protein
MRARVRLITIGSNLDWLLPHAKEIFYNCVEMLNHQARAPLILECNYGHEIFIFSEENYATPWPVLEIRPQIFFHASPETCQMSTIA